MLAAEHTQRDASPLATWRALCLRHGGDLWTGATIELASTLIVSRTPPRHWPAIARDMVPVIAAAFELDGLTPRPARSRARCVVELALCDAESAWREVHPCR